LAVPVFKHNCLQEKRKRQNRKRKKPNKNEKKTTKQEKIAIQI
jgi:hypothetical protein